MLLCGVNFRKRRVEGERGERSRKRLSILPTMMTGVLAQPVFQITVTLIVAISFAHVCARWRRNQQHGNIIKISPVGNQAEGAQLQRLKDERPTMWALFGSGGHSKEMALTLKNLNLSNVRLIAYHTEDFSLQFIDSLLPSQNRRAPKSNACDESPVENEVEKRRMKRIREVNGSLVLAVLRLPWLTLSQILSFLEDRPRVLLINGPGAALPLALAASVGNVSNEFSIVIFFRGKMFDMSCLWNSLANLHEQL